MFTTLFRFFPEARSETNDENTSLGMSMTRQTSIQCQLETPTFSMRKCETGKRDYVSLACGVRPLGRDVASLAVIVLKNIPEIIYVYIYRLFIEYSKIPRRLFQEY